MLKVISLLSSFSGSFTYLSSRKKRKSILPSSMLYTRYPHVPLPPFILDRSQEITFSEMSFGF